MVDMSSKAKHLASSAQAVRPKAAANGAGARHQASAGSAGRVGTSESKRQRARYQANRGLSRWARWDRILLIVGVVALVLLVGSAIWGEVTTPRGTLAVAQTSYNFGDVPIGGGDITTTFPLTVQGDARAIDITST